MREGGLLALVVVVLANGPVAAAEDARAAALAASLRTLLIEYMPNPLHAESHNWGKKRRGPLGRTKNDGRWWKIAITPRDHHTLQLDIRNLQKPGGGRTLFTVQAAMQANIRFERQTWKYGVRLYSGETRARVRFRLTLQCEVQTQFIKTKSFFPDAIIRLRVLKSDFQYHDLVVEHTAGIGGDGARLLGEALIGIVTGIKPSLERNLIAKANAGIVKAADTRQVRISLMDLIGGKKSGK